MDTLIKSQFPLKRILLWIETVGKFLCDKGICSDGDVTAQRSIPKLSYSEEYS